MNKNLHLQRQENQSGITVIDGYWSIDKFGSYIKKTPTTEADIERHKRAEEQASEIYNSILKKETFRLD